MPWLFAALVLAAVALAYKKTEGASQAPLVPPVAPPGVPPASPSFLDWAPGQAPSSPPSTGFVMLDETDTGKSLDLGIGSQFTVRLPAPAATGHVWQIVQTSPAIEQQGEPIDMPGDSTPGGSGGTIFTFKGASPGSVRLVLGLRRPFEPDAAPVRTWEQDVNVWSRS